MSKNTQLGNLVNGIFVDSTGNVGVGTSAPSSKLHVVGTLRVNNPSVSGQYMELYTSSGISYYHSQNNSAFYTAFQHIFNTDGTSATERMRITSGGNVGIGTSSPAFSLDVNGSGRISKTVISSVSVGTINGSSSSTVTIILAKSNTISLGAQIIITGFENQNGGAIMITANVIGNWVSGSLNKYGIGTVVGNESLGANDYRAYSSLTPTVGASSNSITLTLTNAQASSITNVSVTIKEFSN